jgi:hypothetical protein
MWSGEFFVYLTYYIVQKLFKSIDLARTSALAYVEDHTYAGIWGMLPLNRIR